MFCHKYLPRDRVTAWHIAQCAAAAGTIVTSCKAAATEDDLARSCSHSWWRTRRHSCTLTLITVITINYAIVKHEWNSRDHVYLIADTTLLSARQPGPIKVGKLNKSCGVVGVWRYTQCWHCSSGCVSPACPVQVSPRVTWYRRTGRVQTAASLHLHLFINIWAARCIT